MPEKENPPKEQFAIARQYFADHPSEIRLSKHHPDYGKYLSKSVTVMGKVFKKEYKNPDLHGKQGIENSFIQVNGKVYALASQMYLGKGGFGVVKIATNENGEKFAVKVEGKHPLLQTKAELDLLKGLGEFEGRTERKVAGGKKLRGMPVSTKVYTIMGLHKGTDVRKGMSKLSNSQKMVLAFKSVAMIDKIHQLGFVHADVKPENFMMNNEGDFINLTPIDFGFAHEFAEGKDYYNGINASGTPGYVAPEIMSGALYSTASDIYALGVMMKNDFGFNFPIVNQMLATDPSVRPTAPEILSALKQELDKDKNISEKEKAEIESLFKTALDPEKRRPVTDSITKTTSTTQSLAQQKLFEFAETLDIDKYYEAFNLPGVELISYTATNAEGKTVLDIAEQTAEQLKQQGKQLDSEQNTAIMTLRIRTEQERKALGIMPEKAQQPPLQKELSAQEKMFEFAKTLDEDKYYDAVNSKDADSISYTATNAEGKTILQAAEETANKLGDELTNSQNSVLIQIKIATYQAQDNRIMPQTPQNHQQSEPNYSEEKYGKVDEILDTLQGFVNYLQNKFESLFNKSKPQKEQQQENPQKEMPKQKGRGFFAGFKEKMESAEKKAKHQWRKRFGNQDEIDELRQRVTEILPVDKQPVANKSTENKPEAEKPKGSPKKGK